MNWIASFDKYPYAQVKALQTAVGTVAGGQTDMFTAGKVGLHPERPMGGSAEHPPVRGKGLQGAFGVIPFPGTVAVPSTSARATSTSSPKVLRTRLKLSSSSHGSPVTKTKPSSRRSTPRADGSPEGPSVTKQPAYQAWFKANPWLERSCRR